MNPCITNGQNLGDQRSLIDPGWSIPWTNRSYAYKFKIYFSLFNVKTNPLFQVKCNILFNKPFSVFQLYCAKYFLFTLAKWPISWWVVNSKNYVKTDLVLSRIVITDSIKYRWLAITESSQTVVLNLNQLRFGSWTVSGVGWVAGMVVVLVCHHLSWFLSVVSCCVSLLSQNWATNWNTICYHFHGILSFSGENF